MPYLRTLRLNFPGDVSNEYRLRGSRLDFRQSQGKWRVMDESDVLLHFRFNTEVARWLQRDLLEKNPFAPIHSLGLTARES
jgi:hypothetical protein